MNADTDFAMLVLLLVAAPVFGSFAGVLIERLPSGRPVFFARSCCDTCGRTLAPRDLVPLVSWLATQGRCRHCGARIGGFAPAVELAALCIAAWAATQVSGTLLWITAALGWVLLALAVIDWRHFLLPDSLVLPLVPAGLAVAAWLAPSALADHLIGAVAGLAVLSAVAWTYRHLRGREGMGFGDAKLLGAAGAWVGWQGLPSVLLLGALLALAVTLLTHAGRRPLGATTRVSFGSFLCLGLWLVWLYGPLA